MTQKKWTTLFGLASELGIHTAAELLHTKNKLGAKTNDDLLRGLYDIWTFRDEIVKKLLKTAGDEA